MKNAIQFITGAAIATGLIFGGLAISEARAEATWKQTEYWHIIGDYKGWCRAEATYSDILRISMGTTGNGWTLFVEAKSSTPMETGKTYTLNVALTGKIAATLTGQAISPHAISFPGLTPQFVADFAYAPSIKVGDWGLFNLKGSLEAIEETMSCFKAITGTSEAPATPTRRA